MKEHVIKLMPGEDILESLARYCLKHQIEAAYVATCVGSLASVSFRKGISRSMVSFEGPFEIVSMVGTLSKSGMHIHASVSDESFNVKGGHIVVGCPVQSTAEIVIVELEEHHLSRSIDDLSGYKELKIVRVQRVCKE